jgi:hypothetical protein
MKTNTSRGAYSSSYLIRRRICASHTAPAGSTRHPAQTHPSHRRETLFRPLRRGAHELLFLVLLVVWRAVAQRETLGLECEHRYANHDDWL